MRKILLALLLILSAQTFAQTTKLFLSKDFAVVDSSKATYYLEVKKLSDTAWQTKQYDMDGTIVTEGTYRDENLEIPDGKFIYYKKDVYPNTHSGVHYLSETGEFMNGKKEGTWMSFRPDGTLFNLDHYRNDKLNGLHENYGEKSFPITVRGNYVDDLRDGEWYLVDKEGTITRTEIFVRGKKIKTINVPSKIIAPVPPANLGDFIGDSVSKIFPDDLNAKLILSFTINTDGTPVNPHVTNLLGGEKYMEDLKKIILRSPKWSPAYDKVQNIKTEYDVGIAIIVDAGRIKVEYLSTANDIINRYK